MSPRRHIKNISLFSGAGGLDLGLEAVQIQTRVATDIDDHSCRTLDRGRVASRREGRHLFTNTVVLESDIADVSVDRLLEVSRIQPGEVDLLSGGPPCQAFSVFGRRRGSQDPRAQLVYEYLRLLAGTKPKAFVFENVYGLLSIEGGRIFEELCERLAKPARGVRYSLSIHRLNAVDHGVPQFRDRVFIIGDRDGVTLSDIPPLTTPEPNLSREVLPWRTVRDAWRGLPPAGSTYPPNHVTRKHSERIMERYQDLRLGQRDPVTRINKLDPDRPSFTIIVGSDKGGGKGHVHPSEAREVTARESARIQTFPDWWEFSGTSRHPIRQVGNAVPPLLGAAVGNQLRANIFGLTKVPLQDILWILGQEHLFEKDDLTERDGEALLA